MSTEWRVVVVSSDGEFSQECQPWGSGDGERERQLFADTYGNLEWPPGSPPGPFSMGHRSCPECGHWTSRHALQSRECADWTTLLEVANAT